jgi:hypothetical protein
MFVEQLFLYEIKMINNNITYSKKVNNLIVIVRFYFLLHHTYTKPIKDHKWLSILLYDEKWA